MQVADLRTTCVTMVTMQDQPIGCMQLDDTAIHTLFVSIQDVDGSILLVPLKVVCVLCLYIWLC